MTGTRTGMGWPGWKPVHVTGREVIQETGSRKLDHRAPSFSVSEGKKTVESQHLCRGAGRYLGLQLRAKLSSGCICWLRRILERRVGGRGSASAQSSGSWRDRTQKGGEATANGVKPGKGTNQIHIDERLDRCSHQQ